MPLFKPAPFRLIVRAKYVPSKTGLGAPTLTSCTPSSATVDASSAITVVTVLLVGTNLDVQLSGGNASVVLSGGAGVSVNGTPVISSSTLITTSFTIAAGATPGARSVTVTTDSGIATITFTVAAAGASGGALIGGRLVA